MEDRQASDGFSYFTVNIAAWPIDPRGCGRGLLDNVRGQTGAAEGSDWRCVHNIVTFKVSNFYNAPKHIQDAIWLASPNGNTVAQCGHGIDIDGR
ncbi:MAG: hypothetical protein M1832_005173 [Thelocarpon impressellum]|nr:MAG: hypothetical protein M1832_005173 [Thelocarpon impressellum]